MYLGNDPWIRLHERQRSRLNEYAAQCSRCGMRVPTLTGSVERLGGRWQVTHLDARVCAQLDLAQAVPGPDRDVSGVIEGDDLDANRDP
jgi:hypothetical protein